MIPWWGLLIVFYAGVFVGVCLVAFCRAAADSPDEDGEFDEAMAEAQWAEHVRRMER